jgi:16S rRNA (guanine966-N2)-methyltransferase
MKRRQLRIIGGQLRGKKLYPIKGQSIRPTADRVRESIFNILAFQLTGQTVLDLFAGTGALGIEALSRGAVFAYFLDNRSEAIRVIRQNLQACRLSQRSLAVQWDIGTNLACLRGCEPRPSLVLMDPPYNLGFVRSTLERLHQNGVLCREALLVVEHSKREQIPGDLQMFVLTDQRTYGKTLVSFLTYMV